MKTELWGTFSVRDHLRKRPFVTEVLLYDRLMIPRPPTPEEEAPEPGEKTHAGWPAEWEPQKLHELLDILGEHELAVELPWGKQARQDWSKLYHGQNVNDLGARRTALAIAAKYDIEAAKTITPDQAPYIATAGLISMYIAGAVQNKAARRLVDLTRKPGVEIDPVIAYGSYQDFQQEQALRPAAASKPPPADISPYALFGWEFFVPEDSEKSDHDLLRAAARLAARPDFQETRQSFHSWLKKMHDGSHDPEDARVEMLRMLEDFRNQVRGSGIKTAVRYVAKVAPVLAPLAGLFGDVTGIGVGVAVGGAALLVEWLLPEKKPEERVRPAALVHDARRFFGKK
jgi:hypothetical protein